MHARPVNEFMTHENTSAIYLIEEEKDKIIAERFVFVSINV